MTSRNAKKDWIAMAAFASKQVGCGLLHSADSARKIGIERDARRRMEKSGKATIDLPGLKVRRMDEQAGAIPFGYCTLHDWN